MPEPPDKPDTHEKTPPTGSARLASPPVVPTLKTLGNQLIGVAGQLHGARGDIDTVLEWQKNAAADIKAMRLALLGDPKVLHIGTLPSPASLVPPPSSLVPPAPRPSMAVQAAKGTKNFGKWGAIVLGCLTLVGQVVAQASPKYEGPVTAILKVIMGLLTGGGT